jgi:hypothetical protein
VSYDVVFQRFRGGDAVPGGGDKVRAVLEPYVTRAEPERSFVRVEVGDNGADVYLGEDHMMVNHADGVATWDLLVRAAADANWTILLPDGPPALTNADQQSELPAELAEVAVTVSSGADLLLLIKGL